ncbi:unnamed protein product [Rangifer tarandus platyrhynchus]|uniref:Uncharacterized protein n=2 Tax=Rangifer tarandus platyrhynchus TaxID=3082113 RepID=A0ACB0FKY2_RANTA|nr:unnamed protein product [Rangifer tarandus platyrhynchus]CAI9712651.1 unnamed protein product [Rangifer tarandus platyrhynchus]
MKRLSSALISAQAFNTSPANGTHTYCEPGHAVAEGGKPAPGGEDVRDPGGARRRDACLPWAPHAIQASTCDALLLARPAPPWV